jgi:hypothetical protein
MLHLQESLPVMLDVHVRSPDPPAGEYARARLFCCGIAHPYVLLRNGSGTLFTCDTSVSFAMGSADGWGYRLFSTG